MSGFDTFADSVAQNWPWWTVLFLLLVYELWALYTQWAHRHWPETAVKPSFLITLSRMYWRSHTKFPALDPIVLSVLAWLVPHLIVGDMNGAAEWAWTVAFWLAIWIWFIKKQGVAHA